MTAASVLGVPITPARAAACRDLLAGVASAAAWAELAQLDEARVPFVGISPEAPGEGTRHPPFGEPYVVEPPSLGALASCALGTACARCGWPIGAPMFDEEARDGEELADGWCCAACVERQRAAEAFRRRAAAWLKRGVQLGLFGEMAAPARRRKARR
ncbi:MAG: hypothetical protein ACM3O6_13210 [Acidobacteriota bacterium]